MKRLEKIVDYINEDDIVADIGCDHGYLLKLAIEKKNIKKCYAVDNKIGPLNAAKKNLNNYSNVSFILSDGLLNIDVVDINCVVIAGMGGNLVNKIISDSLIKFKNINKLIICPNRNVDGSRFFLNQNEFKIISESMIKEDGKFYEIVVFENGKQILNDKQIFFGPYLLQNKTDVFFGKWTEYYNKIKNIEFKNKEIKMINEVLYEG